MGDAASNHPVLAQSSSDAGRGAATGGFISLDVAALSSLAGDGPETTPAAPPASTPRTPRVVRSLSRKGSERKQADGDAATGTIGGGVQRGDLDSALLHPFHEQDGQRRKRHGSRQRCTVKHQPHSAKRFSRVHRRAGFSTCDL
ncbi:hypothetical protein TRIUR3_20162 [Triticum urartu]|uniref:Uncharacterized protein n=1 Tax=Triticum urartu TaxID=4572 RepID=M8A1E1_TRIUA|nr:hypothetical protein TRIUR3_20162 [Triticum urartu]